MKFTQDQIDNASEFHGKKAGKQIIGTHRRQLMGQKAVIKFVLEDGTELMEDDEGNSVKKWPGEE